jgi:hypothetical protein
VDDRTPPRGAIPDAAKIMLVQDNLNTHKPASLYEAFPAAEARRLVERFEWHYASKHGSWLDMAALVGKRVNLRSAPSSAIIRTSEHFHVFSPPPRLSVRMFGSGGKKRANA